jgi:hypothetical protein
VTPSDDPKGEAHNESVAEALGRAGLHARSCLTEALAAVHALLDATAQAIGGETAASHYLLGPIAAILERLSAQFGDDDRGDAAALIHTIAEALDQEISRWEARAENDADARAVLRAFLGLRELLWEFGVRRETSQSNTDGKPKTSARKTKRTPRTRSQKRRVERVPIEGS